MKPGETRFGALWGPLGVRWTIFGGQDGFMGTLFSHVFVRFDFRLVFSWIFNGFEGRKVPIFYSIFEFFTARAIFANCEFYLRKTYIFHVWEASFSKISKRF